MDTEFRKMDADKNGILTKKEIGDFERAMSAVVSANRRRALFTALDADHNGVLTPAEFAHLQLPAQPIAANMILSQTDLNKDGQVTVVEYRTGKLVNFDRMDTDKDGVVSVAEMRAAGLIRQ
jgi:Ca2+-binding EF-hand superfamily protein